MSSGARVGETWHHVDVGIAKHDLSVHRTILDEIDADRRAAYLFWTLRRALRADTARAAARHRRNRPHWSSTATALANKWVQPNGLTT